MSKTIARNGLVFLVIYMLALSSPAAVGAVSRSSQIKHIIVIVEENHTFDNYFGTYPGANGLNLNAGIPSSTGSDQLVKPFHVSGTSVSGDLCHSSDCAQLAYDKGKMDGFVAAAGSNLTMGYFDSRQIPYYWDYASHFVLLDNFYSSVMSSSLPNHLYLLAGQSGGVIDRQSNPAYNFKTIVDELDQKHVTWKYYAGYPDSFSGWNPLPAFDSFIRDKSRMSNLASPQTFYSDIQRNKLADVVWIMPLADDVSEHPPYDLSAGQKAVTSLINAVMRSDYWTSTAIFVTWDDYGGWYDHVAPPQTDQFGLGFRVPCLIISPYAKEGSIDHTLADFTSFLRFIETVHALQPLTHRDASANDLMEAFDFSRSPRAPFVLPGPFTPNHYPLHPLMNDTSVPLKTPGPGQRLPNLLVERLSLEPPEPKAGDVVGVSYAVRNIGNAAAYNVTVAIYLNDTLNHFQLIQSSPQFELAAGESAVGSFPASIEATAGTHAVIGVVDPIGAVQEVQDDNNAMIRVFSVYDPASVTGSTTNYQSSSSSTTTNTIPKSQTITPASTITPSAMHSSSNDSRQQSWATTFPEITLLSATAVLLVGLVVVPVYRRRRLIP